MSSIPFAEHDLLGACAQRFDGYRYMSETGFELPDGYAALYGTPAWDFTLPQALTIFFMHQRLVMKWGMSRPDGNSDWQLMRRLFVELAPAEIPEPWRANVAYDRWMEIYAPHTEAARAFVAGQIAAFDR